MSDKLLAQRYEIVKSLGQGGMADVYLAIDTILNREVAIKVLRGELSSDPVTLLRFQREANAASKLNHPNVVQVYDVGEYEGRHYIVMEHVRGRTLKQLILRRGALHVEEAVNIMKQLVSAVEHAHENNIIHRDIKPQNVMVKDDGTVKITDFGIALAHDAVQLTQSDSVLGSAHYIAPETTRGEPATNQIDIYALGIVFYELLCGDVPFHGDNPVQIAMKHLNEEMPSVREFNPSLPQRVENIILKATVKNRSLRYKTAKEMLDDLECCLDPNQNDDTLVFSKPVSAGEKTVVLDHVSSTAKNNEEKEEENENPLANRLVSVIGILLIVISVVIVAAVIYFSGLFQSTGTSLSIPDVRSLTVEEAGDQLEEMGFIVNTEILYESSNEVDEGEVIRTKPAIGSSIKKNETVTLVVSRGGTFTIENYVGRDIDEVKALLPSSVEVLAQSKPSKDAKPGTILSQEILLEGAVIDPKVRTNKIKFYYASYPEFVIPNDLLGKSVDSVVQILQELGAEVELKQLPSSDAIGVEGIVPGVVIKVSPQGGTYYIQEEGKAIVIEFY